MTPFKDTNRITSPYGWRTYTNNAGKTIREHHNGIDVVPTRYAGEDVAGNAWDFREVTGGKVVAVSAGWNAGRGTLIKVQTAPGVIEIYQHCAAVYVKVGQQVPQGTVLGRAGATGNVTGAHLHFEVQVNGTPVEPSEWMGLPNAGGTYDGNDTLDKPAEAEPDLSTCKQLITIGPITNGDAFNLQQLCSDLGLTGQGLYHSDWADADKLTQTLTIGPVSSGDAWRIMRQCQALELTDMGLYKSEYVG